MSEVLAALVLLLTLAGGLVMIGAGLGSVPPLVRARFSDDGLDAMRRRLALGIISALSLTSAATLLKTLTLENWTALGLFALVFALRLLIKRSLAEEASSPG